MPPHLHHREDESFYVIEGEFFDDERTVSGGPGTFIYIHKGNLHGFRNVGATLGRMLNSRTPGGLHERFFEEIGEEAQDLTNPPVMEAPPNIERVVRIAAKYGTEFLPPPD